MYDWRTKQDVGPGASGLLAFVGLGHALRSFNKALRHFPSHWGQCVIVEHYGTMAMAAMAMATLCHCVSIPHYLTICGIGHTGGHT